MRLHTGIITAVTNIRPGVVLIQMHAEELARTAQAGQFCMVRCAAPFTSDPLLRRPYFLHSVKREHGLCTLLIHVQGRGSRWLASQQIGAELDLLGPLGHGWHIRPTTRNLLLLSEDRVLSSMTLLLQVALEQELAITLINLAPSLDESYPPALLPPEVEYHVITNEMSQQTGLALKEELSTIPEEHVPTRKQKRRKKKTSTRTPTEPALMIMLDDLLPWADSLCIAVSHETLTMLSSRFNKLHEKHFAQTVYTRPLVCGTGTCFACNIDTLSGSQLVCRDGPVFPLREIVELRQEL